MRAMPRKPVARCVCVALAVAVTGGLVAGCESSGPASPGDTVPPAAVSDLSCRDSEFNSLTLAWTAPGDDGSEGQATAYEIRRSLTAITRGSWDDADVCEGAPDPAPAGEADTCVVTGLEPGTTYHFAMKTCDEADNWSGLSNGATDATTAGVEQIDQSQPYADYGYWFDSTDPRWQEFIPQLDNLCKVVVTVQRVGSPGDVVLRVITLSGTTLCEVTVAEGDVAEGYSYLTIDMANPVSVVPGTEYRIWLLSSENSTSASNRYFWGGTAQSGCYWPHCISSEDYRYPGFKFSFYTYGLVPVP
jgi:hypothetical protein